MKQNGKKTVPDVINHYNHCFFNGPLKQTPSTFLNKYLSAPFLELLGAWCLLLLWAQLSRPK